MEDHVDRRFRGAILGAGLGLATAVVALVVHDAAGGTLVGDGRFVVRAAALFGRVHAAVLAGDAATLARPAVAAATAVVCLAPAVAGYAIARRDGLAPADAVEVCGALAVGYLVVAAVLRGYWIVFAYGGPVSAPVAVLAPPVLAGLASVAGAALVATRPDGA